MATTPRSERRLLWQSDRGRLIEAYSALSGRGVPAGAAIELETLENVLHAGACNDVAFTVGGRYVVLMEHQSLSEFLNKDWCSMRTT